jgi:hypothetical protein
LEREGHGERPTCFDLRFEISDLRSEIESAMRIATQAEERLQNGRSARGIDQGPNPRLGVIE